MAGGMLFLFEKITYVKKEVKEMISKEEFIRRLKNGCGCVCSAEPELTDIDSRFGDADHGFTMVKICNTIVEGKF